MDIKNIYQRMSEATEKISKVAKNLQVGFGKNSYKATKEADVLAAVKPIERECGIYSYPISREIIDTNVITTSSEGKERVQLFLRMVTTYRFVNVDKPEDFIDITTYGDGVDSQDKAPGKAMTYADKYALLKAYKIETGEDPDQNISGELKPNPPTEEQLARINELKIDLVNVGKYYKVDPSKLTTEQVAEAIALKEKALKSIKKESEND